MMTFAIENPAGEIVECTREQFQAHGRALSARITAHASAPPQPSAPAPSVVALVLARLNAQSTDYKAMKTEELWNIHASLKDRAKQSEFYLAHLHPRIAAARFSRHARTVRR